jgi:SOS-response transcriptional repressor LexA
MGRKSKTVPLNSIASRLTQVAEGFGGLTNLARESGVSGSALTRCLNGGDPSVSTAIAICEAASVSLDWFLKGRTSDFVCESTDLIRIPVFSAVASAGPGCIPAENDREEQSLLFPRCSLAVQLSTAPDLFALHANGDSMEPTIRNGSLLIANRTDQQPREGIYVVGRGDTLLVKRTQLRENHVLRLKSDNDQYDDEEIDLKSPAHGVRILGRVIWIGHSI